MMVFKIAKVGDPDKPRDHAIKTNSGKITEAEPCQEESGMRPATNNIPASPSNTCSCSVPTLCSIDAREMQLAARNIANSRASPAACCSTHAYFETLNRRRSFIVLYKLNGDKICLP